MSAHCPLLLLPVGTCKLIRCLRNSIVFTIYLISNEQLGGATSRALDLIAVTDRLYCTMSSVLCRWSVTRSQENNVHFSQILTSDRSSFCIQRCYGLHFILFSCFTVHRVTDTKLVCWSCIILHILLILFAESIIC